MTSSLVSVTRWWWYGSGIIVLGLPTMDSQPVPSAHPLKHSRRVLHLTHTTIYRDFTFNFMSFSNLLQHLSAWSIFYDILVILNCKLLSVPSYLDSAMSICNIRCPQKYFLMDNVWISLCIFFQEKYSPPCYYETFSKLSAYLSDLFM